MAEELAFARKASGLVRGLSMWDAFGVGFMNQGLTPSIWVMTSLGVGIYLGGNLIWATIISVILAGIGFPLVWGILGGSMPRSGGEYIYNSRIIHPVVGIGESFGNAFVWIMWIYVLAPWLADPGMVMMSQFMGWEWAYNAETEDDPRALVQLGHVRHRDDRQHHRLPVRRLRHQDGSRASRRSSWSSASAAASCCWSRSRMYNQADFKRAGTRSPRTYGSLDYDAFLAAVEAETAAAMPTTWNW